MQRELKSRTKVGRNALESFNIGEHTGGYMSKYTETKELLRLDASLKKLTDQDKIAIIHHTDPDGVCSGVLLAKTIEQLRGKPIDLRHNQKSNEIEITQESIDLLKKNNITHVFITDMASDQDPKAIKQIGEFAEVVIIDHHPQLNNVSSEKTILIKAQDISGIPPVKYCTSKMVYDLGSRHTDLSDYDWICAMGVIADRAHTDWVEFMDKTYEKYHLKNDKQYPKTILGILANKLSQTEAYSYKKVGMAFDTLYHAKSYTDIDGSEIALCAKKVDEEIKQKLESHQQWTANNEELDLISGEIISPFAIKSNITTVIAEQYPDKTLVIYQKTEDQDYTLSIRRMDGNVKVNEIITKATAHWPKISAGGHNTNAGATIPEELMEQVLSNIKEELKKNIVLS